MTAAKSLTAFLLATTALAATPTAFAALKDAGVFKPATLRDRPLDEFYRIAAAVDQRDESDYDDNYADDIGDGVFFAPGVTVNGLDIQEPRLSIRGFAVGNSGQRSNIILLRDGARLTDVHGTTNTSEIDLLSTQQIEIYRGVANLREGGGNLGGVIHLRSRTGRDAPAGLSARLDGGATVDGKVGGQTHVSFAGASSGMDFYAGLTGVYENGWRDNNQRVSEQFHGNIGFKVTDAVSTRFFADIVNSETELAGGLTLAQLEQNPQNPTPPITLGPLFPGGPIINLVDGARADDFARDIREGRIANETTFPLLWHDFTIGGHYTRRWVESPQIDFIGFIDQEGSEWGAKLEAERSATFFGGEALYRFGGEWVTGSQDSDLFENLNGDPGAAIAQTEQSSKLLSAFVEGVYKPLRRLAVDVGGKFIKVERELADLTDDDLDTITFTGAAARGGARFDLNDTLQIYAGVSRAFEPPSMEELTAGDPTSLAGFDAQDSFTLEAGLRGSLGGWIGFDLAYYDTDVENEILSLGEPSSFVSGAIYGTADKTTHKGIEAGIDLHLFPETMAARGTALTLRNVYNRANHRIVDGGFALGDVDGNRIAGLPVHHYRGELRYELLDQWFIAANVQLAGGAFFADHENTVSVPTDPILGFSAGYRLNDQIEIFASGENLLDTGYVAGVSPVLTLNVDEDRIFTPGARARLYGGLKYRF